MPDPVITYRYDTGPYTGKGSKLTGAEVDQNFYQLQTAVIELQTGGVFGLDDVEYTGNSIQFNWTSGPPSGPFPLPVATFTYRGLWTNSQTLFRLDTVTVPGVGTYLVNFDHITPAEPTAFDPDADNESGENLYTPIGPAVDLTDYMFFRGTYVGGTQYNPGDVFVDATYGTFWVNILHTGGTPLDPLAEDDSDPIYTQIAPTPFAPVTTSSDTTYEISSADVGAYLRFTDGCIVTFPAIAGLPIGVEIHFRQAGEGAIAFHSSEVTINPPRVGYASSTNWEGAFVTAKYVATDEWDLIGPFGDEAS